MKSFYQMRQALLILLLFTSSMCLAQSKWKVSSVTFSSGFELDAVHDLDQGYFISGLKGDQSAQLKDLTGFNKNLSEMFCENANIRLGISLTSKKLDHATLNLALYKIDDRFDAVEYTFNDYQNSFENLAFKSFSNEAGFDVSFSKSLTLFNFLKLHAAIGNQVGYSYNGRLHVVHEKNEYDIQPVNSVTRNEERIITNTQLIMEESYDMRNALSFKGFLQSGFALVFLDRIELGLMARYGVGSRAMGNQVVRTNLKSYNFTMSYRLI